MAAHHERSACGACLFKPHCLPAGLDGHALAGFERAVERWRRPLAAGQVLVRQGDAKNALYALRIGALKAVIDSADGNERVLAFYFPGAVIGLPEPDLDAWARTLIALEDTWICRIPLHSLDDVVFRQLVKLMSQSLRHEYQFHLTLTSRTGADKLALFLLEISESRRRRHLSDHRFQLPMSYMDVASYLGMRHESLSRSLAELQRRGLLTHDRRLVHIRDLRALQSFVGS